MIEYNNKIRAMAINSFETPVKQKYLIPNASYKFKTQVARIIHITTWLYVAYLAS